MDDLVSSLIVRVENEDKYFEIISEKEITIQEIKKRCLEEFNYTDEDINNIDLYYIDEDYDKNLITNSKDLISFSREMDSGNFLINLIIEKNNNKNIDLKNINEIEEIYKENYLNNNINNDINNYEEKYNKIIQRLKNENNLLQKKINYYKDKIKNIINYYEDLIQKNYNKTKLNQNDKLYNDINNKEIGIQTVALNDLIGETNNIIDEENKNTILEVNKNLEIFYKRCKNCNKCSDNKIFKCLFCDNYFLCNNCYTIDYNKFKIHEHEDFLEIIYPKSIIKQLKEKENQICYNIVNSFYNSLNNILFDKNGNLNMKPFNLKEINNIKEIYDNLIYIKKDPLEIYMNYQTNFIKKEIYQLDEKSKSFISEKINLFMNKLMDLNKGN